MGATKVIGGKYTQGGMATGAPNQPMTAVGVATPGAHAAIAGASAAVGLSGTGNGNSADGDQSRTSGSGVTTGVVRGSLFVVQGDNEAKGCGESTCVSALCCSKQGTVCADASTAADGAGGGGADNGVGSGAPGSEDADNAFPKIGT